MVALVDSLKKLEKPRVVLIYLGLRYEGLVLSVDDTFIEIYDDKRNYRKFLRVANIETLEVVNDGED